MTLDGNEVSEELLKIEDYKIKRAELLLFLFKCMPGVTDAQYKTRKARQMAVYDQFLTACRRRKDIVEYFRKVAGRNMFELQGIFPDDSYAVGVDRPFDAGNHLGESTGRRWAVALCAAAIELGQRFKDADYSNLGWNNYTERVKAHILKHVFNDYEDTWVPVMNRCWRDALLVQSEKFKGTELRTGEDE
jgi:hypothetical protein